MGFLFAKSKKKEIPQVTGLQIQTAVNVLPIPIVYGSPRVPMNIIYVNGFEAVPQSQGGKGGKGLLTGGKNETTGYEYFATFLGAICEGPIVGIAAVFDNQMVYTPTTAPDGKVFDVFYGTAGQAPWATIVAEWPDDAFGYTHTAYLGAYRWPLDSSATIPQLNFLISGPFSSTCPLNLYTAPDATEWLFDADPAECVYDFLTNERYGVEFPTDFIDSATVFTSTDGFDPEVGDAALSTYCQAVGLGWSVALNNAEPASSILERWFKNLVVAPVWTGAILKFIPYYDSPATGNPGYDAEHASVDLKYFTPNTTALFNLSDVDFVASEGSEDPLTFTRKDVADVQNVVRVDYRDRYNQFNSVPVEAKDESSVEYHGSRPAGMVSADEFTIGAYAAASAQMQLQRSVSVRNTYVFKLPLQYCVLDPMDIVQLTDPNLGLEGQNARIVSIEEDEKGVLEITAEEFPIGSASVVAYAREPNEPPTTIDTGAVAPDVNDPVIFEPTPLMLAAYGQSVPYVVIGASGGPGGTYDPLWGGAHVWVSTDDVTYGLLGTIGSRSRHGLLTASLASYSGANPDSIHTLSVDLSMSNGDLESVDPSQAALGVNLCVIVKASGEYEALTYEVATLTGPNEYNLTNLHRGFYGTVGCSHSSGEKFLRVDTSAFFEALPSQYVGVPLYVKLQSFNVWNSGVQPISDVTAYPYVPTGYGTSYTTNPLAQALIALNDVDLDTFVPSVTLDLGAASTSTCIPDDFAVDLGAF